MDYAKKREFVSWDKDYGIGRLIDFVLIGNQLRPNGFFVDQYNQINIYKKI